MPDFSTPLQLWGGLECTINRVHDVFHDQLQRAGHRDRLSDLDLVADLGIRTLRYPLHWERFDSTQSWAPFDAALAELRRLNIRPIAGLLHHGSGPAHTSLLDPDFPEKLAAYALQVATRYPWLEDYTPVNEPNTTARFSALYGHWYPHHRSTASFFRALLNQVKATVLSMAAIRSVNPAARLISTEDGGMTFSTPLLEDHRLYREHRRWLGTDLLCGLVSESHPLFTTLVSNGILPEKILWFAANPCPPAVIGLNYYLTSDRFLDHRVELYPRPYAGGDTGHEPLVDIEALRVHPDGLAGPGAILTQAWQRYGIPVAITEAHLGSTVDDQIRWLVEFWNQAQEARSSGVNVVAVTVWALLGGFDWCTLCTQGTDTYEPGVFRLIDASKPPIPTELAEVVRQLASGTPVTHHALQTPGWWHHPNRLLFPAPERQDEIQEDDLTGQSLVTT